MKKVTSVKIKVDGCQIDLGRKAVIQRGFDRFLVGNQNIDWSKNDMLISVVPKNDILAAGESDNEKAQN